MRGAVILATLTIFLISVAGVTAARENTLTPQEDQMESPVPESTTPELTIPEAPGQPDEDTVETTVVEPEKPEKTVQEEPAPDAENADEVRDDEENEKTGKSTGKLDKPGKSGKAKGVSKNGRPGDTGKPDDPGKSFGISKPKDSGKAGKEKSGGNPGKVTLCHKDRVEISVGAPAEPAHLRHGDILEAC